MNVEVLNRSVATRDVTITKLTFILLFYKLSFNISKQNLMYYFNNEFECLMYYLQNE